MTNRTIILRIAFSLAAICASLRAFQNRPADSDREKDVYAIYSLMLTNPQTSHGTDNNERYLIVSTTVPGYPREPCVQPPREREKEFQEVSADFDRRKATQRLLTRQFSLPKPYVLLSDEEIREFGRARDKEPFRGVTDIFRLSDVYFNQRGTLALTFISTDCGGGLCGSFQWKVFEKLEGTWRERDWVTCTAMARTVPRNQHVPVLRGL
jgi:hypothetical protein